MPTRARPLRIVLRAADRRVRFVFMLMTLIGCSVGFVRASFPGRAHNRVVRTLSRVAGPDDSATVSGQTPLPRNALRRAALVIGPGLPTLIGADGTSLDSSAGGTARAMAPVSYVPSPPFHPPRAS